MISVMCGHVTVTLMPSTGPQGVLRCAAHDSATGEVPTRDSTKTCLPQLANREGAKNSGGKKAGLLPATGKYR